MKDTGETVLHICAEYEKIDIFNWFVDEYKCDVNGVNDFNETPFMTAAREGKIKIIQLYNR